MQQTLRSISDIINGTLGLPQASAAVEPMLGGEADEVIPASHKALAIEDVC